MKRLNLGAGNTKLEGFEPRDAKLGDSLMPLPDPDASVDEIYASHVLEHFSFGAAPTLLAEWTRVLKPGGIMRIAVPDFEVIARAYLDGKKFPVQAVVMGAQIDEHDFHRALFDEECLCEAMRNAGLRGIHRWHSEIEDAAALPISLNLVGYKPGPRRTAIAAVMSVPRLGFIANMGCIYELARMGIPLRKISGAFWGQCLTNAIEMALEESHPEYILTIDYDSVFGREDIEALLEIALHHPEADALAALQAHRGHGLPLLFIRGEGGRGIARIERTELNKVLVEVSSAHFGLTLIKADVFASIAKPWFSGTPDPEGRWGEGKTDDDIHFWRQLEAAGRRAYVTPRVVIGHLVERILWPDINLEPIYQDSGDYFNKGIPEAAWK